MKVLDQPSYGLADASRYLKLPVATLRSWTIGRSYPLQKGEGRFEPLIDIADPGEKLLSFANLVEAYVLRALRQKHGVPIKAVRSAIDFTQKKMNISRLLLRHDLYTSAGDLFLEKYGELVNLSRSGQIAMRRLLNDYLERIDWKKKIPNRLFPFIDLDRKKLIAIDPSISFGRPVLIRKGISTSVIVDRIDAGEEDKEIMEDYGLRREELEIALVYEKAA